MTIGVIVAMRKELESLSALLHDKRTESAGGFEYLVGELGTNRLVLHQSGIGKVNAAIGASELIRGYHPQCIVSSGVAGGLDDKASIMSVVAAEDVVYHDVHIDGEGEGLDITKTFACDSSLVEKARMLSLTSSTRINIGQICTGDQFVTERPALEDIKRRFPRALAVDMESCAIAQTARIYGVPFISFRIISDTIGSTEHQQEYDNFWETMATNSFDVVKAFLEMIQK